MNLNFCILLNYSLENKSWKLSYSRLNLYGKKKKSQTKNSSMMDGFDG